MIGLLLTLTTPMFVLCAIAIFVVLFATVLRAMKEMSLFTPGTSIVVAFCVSVLCMVGLQHFLLSGEGGQEVSHHASKSDGRTTIEIILLPYAALAIVIILYLLLVGIARIFAGSKQREYIAKKKTPVIKSEQVQNTDEEKRIRK